MSDLRCYDDLDPFAEELDDPLEELAQDNFHRLITPRGMNADDPDLGLGIADMLSGAKDGTIGPRIEAELLKDERNLSVKAAITEESNDAQGVSIRIDLEIETSDGVLTDAISVNPTGAERV